jgi:predicted phosphodiesterase
VRVALVSDVHGNAVALRAVLGGLERETVEAVVCLGDVAQGGPQPDECVDLVRDLGCPVVLGNADAFLLDPTAGREVATDRQLEVREWSVRRLGQERLDLIRSFEPTVELDLGSGDRLLAFHGSPTSFDDVLLPDLPGDQLRALVGEVRHRLLAGGHVHLQWLRRFGDSLFVNPGSVGLGYDHEQAEDGVRFDPFAAYAIATIDGGRVEISFRRIPFDAGAFVDAIRGSGLPHGDDFARQWLPSESG